jgi:hypothetical protein
MRPRGRTKLAVLGFLLVLVGGLASALGLFGVIEVARNGGYLTSVGWVSLLAGPAMVVAGVVILVRLHRRWGPPESYGPGTVVYAWSRRSLIGSSLFSAVGALVFLFIGLSNLIGGLHNLVEGHGFTGHGGGLWSAFLGIVGLGFGLTALALFVLTVRRLDHQDPLFVVDEEGIECALGQFAWRHIDRVLQVTQVTGSGDEKKVHRRLAFVLRAETMRRPVERPYEAEDVVAFAPFGFVIGITNGTKQANAALAAYGHAPVNGELSELVPAPPPGPAVEPPPAPAPAREPGPIQTSASHELPWPSAAGWQATSPSEREAPPGEHGGKRPVRGIRRGLLVALGGVMVLVGGLMTIGIIGASTSRHDNPSVGGLVAGLIIGLALVGGGGALMYRLLRRREPIEAPGPAAGIAGRST